MTNTANHDEILSTCVELFNSIAALGRVDANDAANPMVNAEANDLADNLCTQVEAFAARHGISSDEFTHAIWQDQQRASA